MIKLKTRTWDLKKSSKVKNFLFCLIVIHCEFIAPIFKKKKNRIFSRKIRKVDKFVFLIILTSTELPGRGPQLGGRAAAPVPHPGPLLQRVFRAARLTPPGRGQVVAQRRRRRRRWRDVLFTSEWFLQQHKRLGHRPAWTARHGGQHQRIVREVVEEE